MKKYEKKQLLAGVRIENPCGIDWNDMSGDDQIRICSQCNLKVHNLSNMSENEAAVVLKKRETERTCIYFLRKADGSVVVDNCPRQFRGVRDRIFGSIAATLICVAYGIQLGAPGMLSEFFETLGRNGVWRGYDADYYIANLVAEMISIVSIMIVFFMPLSKEKKESKRRMIVELFALSVLPVLVRGICFFVVNSCFSRPFTGFS